MHAGIHLTLPIRPKELIPGIRALRKSSPILQALGNLSLGFSEVIDTPKGIYPWALIPLNCHTPTRVPLFRHPSRDATGRENRKQDSY